MDVRYINPFIEAVQSLFQTTLGADVLIGKPALKDKNTPRSEISALIGFSGGAAGHVGLCFSKTSAVRIASRFAKEEIALGSPDLADALGEMANVVAGQAKAKMDGMGIAISLPRVLAGDHIPQVSSIRVPILVLLCDSQLGRFNVEVSMELNQNAAARREEEVAIA